ncbi:MAG: hypothetical protein V4760_07895 [Bdellovibrionota bacterium]
MRSNLWILTAAMVSVLGLTSCSPDSNEDPWRLNEPYILDPANPAKKISISGALMELPSAGAELVFSDGDLEGGTIDVVSSCRADQERVDDQQSLHSLHRIPLGSLWPSSLWTRLTPKQLEESVCSFAFVARNSKGSTHAFEISGLRLRGFGTLEPRSAKRVRGENWSLICDGFTTELKDEEEAEASQSVHSLALRATNASRPLGHQACRLLSKKEDSKTRLKKFDLSESFELSFPNPRGQVTPSWNLSVLGSSRAASEPILSIRIENQSAFPIAYRIVAPTSVKLQPLMRMVHWSHLSKTPNSLVTIGKIDETLASKIVGAEDTWSQDGFQVIVVSANSSATMSIGIASPYRCTRGEEDLMAPAPGSTGVNAELSGFYFGFSSAMTIESIDYWSATRPREPSESYTSFPISIPVARAQPLLDGFQGLTEYSTLYDASGSAPNPGLVRVDEGMVTKWCRLR